MQGNVNIPDSTITTNLSFRQLVLMNMQQLTNFPYIEKDFDALTDYELLCLVVKYLNDVIANQNEQNDSITRMYESFLALQTYVNNTKDTLEDAFNNLDDYVRNYFDNLDVQDEINNKLDQMLEDGVLEQIIEQFLQLTSLICFDNVSSMKNSVNLANGSYAQTLGYYTKNDGGSALYKIRTITNDDVVDEMFIIEMNNDNNLIAELIINANTIKAEQVGIKSDNSLDQSLKIQNLLNKAISLRNNIHFGSGTFCFSGIITIPETQNGIEIKGAGGYSTQIKSLTNTSQLLFTNFLRFKLNDLYFNGTGQEEIPLIYISGTANLSEINNCIISSNMGLKIDTSAYLNLNHCSFNNKTGYVTNYLLNVKGEYFYANNCYFEGQSNSVTDSKAVILTHGQQYYFNNCDFCNWNNGYALTLDSSNGGIKNIHITESTFVRNEYSIHTYCDNGIYNFELNNNEFIFLTGNELKIFYNERRTGTSGLLDFVYGRNRIDGSTLDVTKQMFTSSGWLVWSLLEFSSTLGFPDYDDGFRLKFYANFPKTLTISSGDQSSKTMTILSRSPYKLFNLPNIVPIKYNGLQWTDYTVSNTYQGALTITFNFSGTGAYTQAYLKIEDV